MKQYQVEELTDLSLDLGGDYKAIVEVTVNDKGTRREQTHCFLSKSQAYNYHNSLDYKYPYR